MIRGLAGQGRLAPVLRADVADALVATITEDEHAGATYDLAGPRAFDVAELDAELSQHGRAVT